ncbi:hypothetical protein EST38_g9642 [Candolleomyces aberdarensis]|uniref:Uncharacterized protein n=1 Tax=Candolleomyces aberdarensis TaxID=2316362 RepID=A0A4Q2DCP7_9AGAR|nr:hypothetical protein EST38_g9642 [Candolleomyces aberdarensis]
MAESTHSGGRGNHGPPDNPERNAPISSQAATLGTDGSQPPSRAGQFKAQVVERVDRTEESMQRMGKNVKRGPKTFLGKEKPTNQGEAAMSAQDVAGSAIPASDNANAMGGLDRDGEAAATEEALGASAELETAASLPQPYAVSSSAMVEQPLSPKTVITSIVPKPVLDAFETALGIAVTLIPDPFKGPTEALLKVVDVVEKADSNKEEVKILKKHCDLLGSSIVNAVKGKDKKLLSEDLKDSIRRLVVGICNTLEAANKEPSRGFAGYVLAEDDVKVLKNANKKLNKLLQQFWIENHITGTIDLSNILATIQDQEGWMQGLSATLGKQVKVCFPCFSIKIYFH